MFDPFSLDDVAKVEVVVGDDGYLSALGEALGEDGTTSFELFDTFLGEDEPSSVDVSLQGILDASRLGGSAGTDIKFSLESVEESLAFALSMEDEDTSSEIEELISMRERLESKGYTGLEDLDYEQLETLEKREVELSDPDYMESCNSGWRKIITTSFVKLATSNATLFTASDSLNEVDDRCKPKQVPNGLSEKLANITQTVISDLLSTRDDVTPADVLERLIRRSTISPADLELQQKVLVEYLEAVTPIAVVEQRARARRREKIQMQRERTSKYLMKDELAYREVMRGDIKCLKQIEKVGNRYFTRCQSCGELFELTESVVSYIIFPVEKTRTSMLEESVSRASEARSAYFTRAIPKAITCACGQNHALALSEYLAITKFLNFSMKAGAGKFSCIVINFGKGTAFSRVLPSLNILDACIPYLITEHSSTDEHVARMKAVETHTESVNTVISDLEFKRAVDAFYSRLGGLNAEEAQTLEQKNLKVLRKQEQSNNYGVIPQMGKVTYKELAYFFTNNLSLDYTTTKNQAIFSLLFTFKENPIVSDILDSEIMWSWKNDMILINSAPLDVEYISIDLMLDLYIMYKMLQGTQVDASTCDINTLGLDNTEFRVEIMQNLYVYRDSLISRVKSFEVDKENFVKELSLCKDALAFTKTVNLKQYKLKDFRALVTDATIFSLLDEISDRMIINNLAAEYYKIIVTLGIFNNNTLQSNLLVRGERDSAAKGLYSMLEKGFTLGAVNSGVVFMSDINRVFSPVTLLTANKHRCLHDLNVAFKGVEFYKFLEIASGIPTDLDTMHSQEYRELLQEFLRKAQGESTGVVTTDEVGYYQYYLTEFTLEEITANIDLLSSIEFKRFVPHKVVGEKLSDYIARYKVMFRMSALNEQNSRDYLKEFNRYSKYYALLLSCSTIYDLEHTSFASAMFVSCLAEACVKYCREAFTTYIFGVNGNLLNVARRRLDVIEPSNLRFELAEVNYRVLTGYYYTAVQDFMAQELPSYSRIFIKTINSLNDLKLSYDVTNTIKEYLAQDASAFVKVDDGEESNSEEEIIAELQQYDCGYAPLQIALK